MKLFMLVLLCPVLLFAGNDPLYTGARENGMANASVTLAGSNSIFHNQAGLGFQKNIGSGLSYENRFLVKELSTNSAFFVLPLKPGTLGVSFSTYGFALYHETSAGLAMGKSFGEKFSAGMKINWISAKIGEGYGSRNYFVGEAGIIVKPLKKMKAGIHVYNPTMVAYSDYDHERIPTVFNFGLDYQIGEKVLVAAGIEKDLLEDPNFKAGMEYQAAKNLFLRGGFNTFPMTTSFGVGYGMKNFRFDISSSWHNVLGFSPSASLIYEMK